MNFLQLEYFLTVARNLNFTKSAEELYVTQPAVSRQISILEKELGISLFDRTNKATKLTEAGEMYYEFFQETNEKYKNLQIKVKKLTKEKKGKVRLGCLEGWDISGFSPEVIEKFKQDYPSVQLSLECHSVRGLIYALKNDDIDAAMSIDVTLKNIEEFQSEELTSIPRLLLYSKRHPLARKQNLRPEDFANETFFVMSKDEASYGEELVREYMRPFGFEAIVQQVKNIESANACVLNGMGVEISDWWSSISQMRDFHYIPIGSRHPIVLAWKKKNENESIKVLANELKFILEHQIQNV